MFTFYFDTLLLCYNSFFYLATTTTITSRAVTLTSPFHLTASCFCFFFVCLFSAAITFVSLSINAANDCYVLPMLHVHTYACMYVMALSVNCCFLDMQHHVERCCQQLQRLSKKQNKKKKNKSKQPLFVATTTLLNMYVHPSCYENFYAIVNWALTSSKRWIPFACRIRKRDRNTYLWSTHMATIKATYFCGATI